MSKSSGIYTRVEPEIKEKAEEVLSSLGIPITNAINLFLHQVILQQGIPFDIKLPQSRVIDFSLLTPEQLDVEIEKGFRNIDEGKVISSRQLREKIEQRYKI